MANKYIFFLLSLLIVQVGNALPPVNIKNAIDMEWDHPSMRESEELWSKAWREDMERRDANKLYQNFFEWQALHRLYMEVFKLTVDDPSNYGYSTSFDSLVGSDEERAYYLEFIASLEEFCAETENELEKACRDLRRALEKVNMQDCIGQIDLNSRVMDASPLVDEINEIVLIASNKELERYSNSKETQDMIATLRKNLTKRCASGGKCQGKRTPGSVRQCWKYVKHGLLGGGFTKTYPSSTHAKDAGPILKKMGFKNLLENPEYKKMTGKSAPVGAVLVYSGGASGHIEVKAGDNEYLSDFKSVRPINESRLPRKLIGIYIK